MFHHKHSVVEVLLLALFIVDPLMETPLYPSKGKSVCASPINVAHNNLDAHNLTDGTKESRVNSRNGTLKDGASKTPLKNNLSVEKGKIPANESSNKFASKIFCISGPDGSTAESDECFYGIGVFISMTTMFIMSSVFQASIEPKHILSWNLLLYYCSQVFFHLFFMFRDWNFHFTIDCITMMRDIATFANFFLLTTLSWSSIMSSDLCMVKSYVIWDVKKVNGAIRITNRVAFLQASALIAVIFSCVSMGVIYSIHVMTYVHECNPFCWVIQKNSSPLMFTVTVMLMAILNFICFCRRMQLNGIGENYPEFEYYVFHVRKNNNIFFCLSVFLYIMWGFNVVASILDISWLWTLYLVIFDLEGLVLFIIHQCNKTRNYIPDPNDFQLRELPRPPRYRINTVATQTKAEA